MMCILSFLAHHVSTFLGQPHYNAIHPKRRQACLAHLIRKAKEIADRIELMPKKKQGRNSLRFCKSVKKFFVFCCRIDQRRKNGSISFSAAKAHITRLQRTLDTICLHPLADADAENDPCSLTPDR